MTDWPTFFFVTCSVIVLPCKSRRNEKLTTGSFHLEEYRGSYGRSDERMVFVCDDWHDDFRVSSYEKRSINKQ
jgi:hypothetical protein